MLNQKHKQLIALLPAALLLAATGCGTRDLGGDIGALCTSNQHCTSAGAYCNGNASSPGVCTAKPNACDTVVQPVCGVDGKTYNNACEAGLAGVAVKHDGACGKPVGCVGADGKRYKPGDRYPAPDGCNTCTCGKDGSSACTEMACAPGSCKADGDCASDEYCAKNTCGTAAGVCASRPQACDQSYDPVCGCDNKTYGNACGAASAGVNVASKGECGAPSRCTTNKDCKADQYCEKPGCHTKDGACKPRPQACIEIYDPVCGCDNKTYSNSCHAAGAGVNVASKGTCGGCTYDGKQYKIGDTFPSTDGCNTCSCTSNGVSCTKRACQPGACTSNSNCKATSFCLFATGCGGIGRCTPRPQGCAEYYAPVCGCDNKTYGNECAAHSAGVAVSSIGVCAP